MKGLSPVAVSFKLRKFKCNIADKKKLKVKLIPEIYVKYNRNLPSLGMIDLKLGVKKRTSSPRGLGGPGSEIKI